MAILALPDALFKQHRIHDGTCPELLYENIDTILARTIAGPLQFSTNLAEAPWIFDVRFLGHVFVGMNGRMELLRQMPEWIPMGIEGQHAHKFVALIYEVATALLPCETLDWIGCPAVPEHVLEAIQIRITTVDPAWSPHPTTESLAEIKLILRMATGMYALADKIKRKHEVYVTELRKVLDVYEVVRDESTSTSIFHGENSALQ